MKEIRFIISPDTHALIVDEAAVAKVSVGGYARGAILMRLMADGHAPARLVADMAVRESEVRRGRPPTR